MTNLIFFHLILGCNSSGSAKINQEIDSGNTEYENSADDTATIEDTAQEDTNVSTEPASEPDNAPVDNDGDGVFEDDCDDSFSLSSEGRSLSSLANTDSSSSDDEEED